MSSADISARHPVQGQVLCVRALPREEIVVAVKVCVLCSWKMSYLFCMFLNKRGLLRVFSINDVTFKQMGYEGLFDRSRKINAEEIGVV